MFPLPLDMALAKPLEDPEPEELFRRNEYGLLIGQMGESLRKCCRSDWPFTQIVIFPSFTIVTQLVYRVGNSNLPTIPNLSSKQQQLLCSTMYSIDHRQKNPLHSCWKPSLCQDRHVLAVSAGHPVHHLHAQLLQHCRRRIHLMHP